MITDIVEKTAFAVSTVGRDSYPEAEMFLQISYRDRFCQIELHKSL